MSYCVHCGVELAPSEARCPLCKTPVVDPNGAWHPPEEKPYPEQLEVVPPRIDHRYGAALAALFLLIPASAVLASDLLINHRITWSAYVLGAMLLVGVWVLLPFALDVRRPYLYLTVDTFSTALYLEMIAFLTGGAHWYLTLALPLTVLAGGALMLGVYACRRKRLAPLDRASAVVAVFAAALVALEALTDLWARGGVRLEWSLYALVPLIASAGVLRVIERRPRLKEEIKKRLFL